MPTAGAVAAALHDLDGEWRDDAAHAAGPPVPTTAERAGHAERCEHHRRPGLRPPPPLLGPRPGHAGAAAQPATFAEILEQVWWRLDRALDLEMIRWSAMLGALEALECGHDGHRRPPRVARRIEGSLTVIAEACAEVGVRVAPLLRGHRPPRRLTAPRRGLAENERFLRAGGAAWSASTPLHLLGRDPRGRRRPGRRPGRRGAHPRRRGHGRRRRRRPAREAGRRRLAAGPRRPPRPGAARARSPTTRGPT